MPLFTRKHNHQISNAHVTLSKEVRLNNAQKVFAQYRELINSSDKPTTISFPFQHVINTGNTTPIETTTRQYSPLDHARIDQALNEMLQKGIISPSHSDWVSKPHTVKKDDGIHRFYVDFRKLNEVTIHDLYPLSRIDDLFNQLGCSMYFTSIDLMAGYWQIPIDPRDAHKTTFRT